MPQLKSWGLFLMTTFLLILALINPVPKIELDLSLHLADYTSHRGEQELNKKQLIKHIIEPVLKDMGLYSEEAVRLLVMIVAHESQKGYYIIQTTGQAKGIYQMEDATHDDIVIWLRSKKPALYNAVQQYNITGIRDDANEMIGNLYYATALARAFFLRFPEALPKGSDRELAEYAKKRWNTYKGKATADDYLRAYQSWK